jgi:hypothetical protein
MLDLQAQYRPLRDEILAAMTRVADSQRFIMGPEITALEGELAPMLGVKHAIALSSGTDAVLLALMALDIAGDEVVTTRIRSSRRPAPWRALARGRSSWTSIPGHSTSTLTGCRRDHAAHEGDHPRASVRAERGPDPILDAAARAGIP